MSCSHTRIAFQPRPRSALSTSPSRSRLRKIFCRQNVRLLFGIVPCCGQPCQKQPSTNTAILPSAIAISGVPGSLIFARYLSPLARRADRKRRSRSVPRCLTRDIRSLRCAFVSESICDLYRLFWEPVRQRFVFAKLATCSTNDLPITSPSFTGTAFPISLPSLVKLIFSSRSINL